MRMMGRGRVETVDRHLASEFWEGIGSFLLFILCYMVG